MGGHHSRDYRFRGGYNMGYRPPFYDGHQPGFYDHEPIDLAFRPQPFDDGYRRDSYRREINPYVEGRYGALPMEDVYRRLDAGPHWMDQGRYVDGQLGGGYRWDRYDRHGGHLGRGGYRMDRYDNHGGGRVGGGYRISRYDHHGGQGYLHDVVDDDLRHHGNHQFSRSGVVELYVPICCDKCERKLRKHLDYVQGVEDVTVDQITKKVEVFGRVDPGHILNLARQDKPESDFWYSAY